MFGVLIDKKSRLYLFINGEDLGFIVQVILVRWFVVFDLYGCCEEVFIVIVDYSEGGYVCMEEIKVERSLGEGDF